MKKVYLAGPITGKSWDETEGWRNEIKLHHHKNVTYYSPLRMKDYLRGEEEIKDRYSDHFMSSAKSIMARDFFDVQTSDAVVVNLRGATKVSIGTVMEIAWAYQRRIPIIAIVDPDNRIHDHAMLNEAITWKVETVDEAVQIVWSLFNP